MKAALSTSILLLFLAGASFASTDTGFLSIQNPGNSADSRVMSDGTSGYGSVGYVFHISKYAVTNAEWNAFVSAVGGPTGTNAGYSKGSVFGGDKKPVQDVSWFEAAQYCNWLTTGDKSQGAYLFSGDNANAGAFLGVDREQAMSQYGKVYVIPTEDEWYKAAYYDITNDLYRLFANGSDIVPPVAGVESLYHQTWPFTGPWDVDAGTAEMNGTYNMQGNAWEWTESAIGSYRVLRGGAYDTQEDYILSATYRHYIAVQHGEFDNVSFRVAMLVPEPASAAILALGGLALLKKRRRA